MSDIKVTAEGPVFRISLARTSKKNAISSSMYAALSDALAAAVADPAVRVVTIGAEGETFCAGNDIGDFLDAPPLGPDQPVLRFLAALAAFPKPIVASVRGAAVGIGTTLLLHCDLVIAAPDALFSMPFVDLALVPEAGSSLLFPRLVGQQRAALHLLLGEPFNAAQARKYGLVAGIDDDPDARAQALAMRLAAKPPEALRATRALIRAPDEPVEARIAREAEAFAERLQSAEAREAFTAFLEKRLADFD